jgi:hypothetical protein
MAEKYWKAWKALPEEISEEDEGFLEPEEFEDLESGLTTVPLPESAVRKTEINKLIIKRNKLLAKASLEDIRSKIRELSSEQKKKENLLKNFEEIIEEQTLNELHEALVNLGLVKEGLSEEEMGKQYTKALGEFIPKDRKGPIEVVSKSMAKKYGK